MTMVQREFNSNTTDEIELLDAADRGDVSTVVRLLKQGLDPNTRDMRADPWNVTPLMRAAMNGHVYVARELLAAKARVNLADRSFAGEGGGETALHYAARGGQITMAELLLANNADINKVSRTYGSPLMVAVEKQQKEMVQFLLRNGASTDVAGKDTLWTPLHVAAFKGSAVITMMLVDAGANVNAKDHIGNTPFMMAAFYNPDVALLLIEHEPDLDSAELDGTSCLMWAVLGKSSRLVSAILKRNINVNALDNEGKSALDFAIRDNLPKIQTQLMNAGAKTGAELLAPNKLSRRKVP